MAKKQAPADQAAPKSAESIASLELELDPAPSAAPDLPAAAADTPAPAPTAPTAPAAADSPATPPREPDPVAGADDPSLLPSAVALARARGYEVSDNATDDDFWSHLESLESDREKFTALETEAADLRRRLAQAESQQQPPQQQQPATSPEQKPATTAPTAEADLEIPERPQLDPVTLGILQVAQANGLLKEAVGGLIATDDANMRPHVEAYNKHAIALRQYDAEWTPKKIAAVEYERLSRKDREERDALKRQLESLQREQAEAGVQGAINAYFDKHKAAYFDLDAEGNVIVDPTTGEPRGERYAQLCQAWQEGIELGITDRAKLHRYAIKQVPPVAPAAAAAPTPKPAEKVVMFRNRLKNNGHADTLPTAPVSRPAAGARTRDLSGLSFNQAMDQHFSDLMNEKVADRM